MVVAAVAAVAGVFIAALAALAGAVFLLVRAGRKRAPLPPAARRPAPPGEAIDVVATEVPPDSLPR